MVVIEAANSIQVPTQQQRLLVFIFCSGFPFLFPFFFLSTFVCFCGDKLFSSFPFPFLSFFSAQPIKICRRQSELICLLSDWAEEQVKKAKVCRKGWRWFWGKEKGKQIVVAIENEVKIRDNKNKIERKLLLFCKVLRISLPCFCSLLQCSSSFHLNKLR